VYRDENACYRIEGYGSQKLESNPKPTVDEVTVCILKHSAGISHALKAIQESN
jgi:hypothetical protein